MQRDRIEVVFDATERNKITRANRTPDDTDNLQQTQTSTFSLLRGPANSAAVYRILEKEVITDYKTSITRSRVWPWDPELEGFRPAPCDSGEARPAHPAAKNPAAAPPAKTPPK